MSHFTDDEVFTQEYVNKIPLNNIWWLLLYDNAKTHNFNDLSYFVTENYKNELIPILLLKIFNQELSHRLKVGLHRDYIAMHDISTHIRGKIDLSKTHHNKLLQQGKIAINYECLTNNSLINQLLLSALIELIKIVKRLQKEENPNENIKKSLYLVQRLRYLGVKNVSLHFLKKVKIRLSHHNRQDQRLINLAQLSLHLTQFIHHSHRISKDSLHRITLDPKKMYYIYERALRNFFSQYYKVGKKNTEIYWKDMHGSPVNHPILPKMFCDILIQLEQFSLIIDTKFMPLFKDRHTIRPAHLYQIYTYVKQQNTTAGLLLYPAVEPLDLSREQIDSFMIDDKFIFVAQFSLVEKNYHIIEQNLRKIIDTIFHKIKNSTSL